MEDTHMITSPLPFDSLHSASHRPSSSKSDSSGSSSSQLPEGQCQAIMVGRGAAAGHRCPCNHFTLNQNSPATVCECGHMSCYHAKYYNSFDRLELRKLQDQIRLINERMNRDQNAPLTSLSDRVSSLEDLVERNHNELGEEVTNSSKHIAKLWELVAVLEKSGKEIIQTLPLHSHQIQALGSKVDSYHAELMDSDIVLEERIDRLESGDTSFTPVPSGYASKIESLHDVQTQQYHQQQIHQQQIIQLHIQQQQQILQLQQQQQLLQQQQHQLFAHQQQQQQHPVDTSSTLSTFMEPVTSRNPRPTSMILPATEAPRRDDASNPPRQTLQPVSVKFPATSSLSESWTVHISLLPNRSQPFPFEKDTRAYKRCLSRGLHRYVVVADHSAEAFSEAVTNAFGDLLRGRDWMPLQAKLCDVHDLQGLPMLRQLESSLQNTPYDLNFLRTHCAVLCPGGKLDSLYIAMKDDTFSWNFLRECPVYMTGLDSCWQYDQFIDNENGTVGDLGIVAPLKKRGAAEISRVANFGAYAPESMPTASSSAIAGSTSSSASATITVDGNISRPKIPRTAPGLSSVPDVPRAVETI